jgi:hypothetical protein
VNDIFDDKSAPLKTVPQHEIDAQLLREKTARLRALRLAQEAANGSMSGTTGTAGKRSPAKKKSSVKTVEKSVSLSDWLSTQDKEGRRN